MTWTQRWCEMLRGLRLSTSETGEIEEITFWDLRWIRLKDLCTSARDKKAALEMKVKVQRAQLSILAAEVTETLD